MVFYVHHFYDLSTLVAVLPAAVMAYTVLTRHGVWMRRGLWFMALVLVVPAVFAVHLMTYAAGHWPCDGQVWPPFDPAAWPRC